MLGIDLFAGCGGMTTGATQSGVNIIWAANHNPIAVACHEKNHPNTIHTTQDLQQANWDEVPKHTIMYGAPCCQGHSHASGRKQRSAKADASRSTAWAVVSCLEIGQAPFAVIENVPDFLKWDLFPAWEFAIKSLGYSLSYNIINAADLGIPQSRKRLFVIITKSANPIKLDMKFSERRPARDFIDLNFDNHKWDLVKNKVPETQRRVENGRARFGRTFLDASYSSEKGGRSLDKPIGAITCTNHHYVVIGDYIRPITIPEMMAAQTFPSDFILPDKVTPAKMMIGNAVPPEMAKRVTLALLQAA